MRIKIKKIDFMEFLFLMLILTSEHFFYLVSLPIAESDLAIIISFIMFFVYLFRYNGVGLRNTDKVTKIMLAAIALLVVCSAIRSQRSYGQSIIMGLRPQRYYLILLAYFPIKNVILNRAGGFKWIINVMVGVGITATIIYSIQYLLFPFQFLSVGYDFRFGQVRLRFNEVGTLFSLFYAYYKMIKRPCWNWGLVLVIHLFYYIVVIKGRSGIIVLTLVLAILLVLFDKQKWKAAICIFSVAVILLYAPIPIIDQYMEGFREGIDSYQSQTDVRYKGQQFYMQSVLEDIPSIIFGKGYVNNQSSSAIRISRAMDFYIVDNGYFGLAYFYGLFGVACNIFMYLYIAVKGYRLQKKLNLGIECGVGIGIYLTVASILVPYTLYYYTHCLLAVELALIDKMKQGEERYML